MSKNQKSSGKFFFILAITLCALLLMVYPTFLLGRYAFNKYFENWGERLVNLEKRGLLSNNFGAGWQDVLISDAMEQEANRLTSGGENSASETVKKVDGIIVNDYPSLSIISQLREIKKYSNSIEIADRLDRQIASITTDHERARFDEFPSVLVKALIAAEDNNFYENHIGFEFDSFVRATLFAFYKSAISFKKVSPRGTSTITQQVAKLFISRLDESGRRHVSRSVDRKLRELRLSAALRKMYAPQDILEVYMNHCVTSDYGLIGYKDIARGLFNKELDQLTDAQCVYLSRMVKWGRNVRSKIINQCHIDMPRIAQSLQWDEKKQRAILKEIDRISFSRPKRFKGGNGPLIDLANEFWLLSLERNGSTSEQIEQMNLIDPNSLIRKKGNLKIRLTIDLPLQLELERLVNARGYGPDTLINAEQRIGSVSSVVHQSTPPKDTIREITILKDQVDFKEPNSTFITTLGPGDTVLVNKRYRQIQKGKYRLSTFYYVRKPMVVNGQYYAYSIMDSHTGKLLAYYSKDRLGSRLACLLKNRTPNGSSTTKPIMNALAMDLGIFKPYSKWTDSLSVNDQVAWNRKLDYEHGKKIGVVFGKSAVKGQGYKVHNHDYVFEGCQYVFDLLATSNNILGVESVYRLDRELFSNREIREDAFPIVQLFYRIGAFSRIKDELKLDNVTGVRVYKELARIVGVDIDSMVAYGKKIHVSDSLYSIALGTLEMSLYEQMHLFNVLYNNTIIENPASHPSLVIDTISLNGKVMSFSDTLRSYHPFADINNLRPSWLGMHKRLISNAGDGLQQFDIAYDDSQMIGCEDNQFKGECYQVFEPCANYAKSGTTDDVIRPFNVDASSNLRTNYGLWNAVIRIDMGKLPGGKGEEIKDLTIACIGECNTKFTGARDGKSLHKFLTSALLKKAGLPVVNGFFKKYESYIQKVTPESENCGNSIIEKNSIQPELIEVRGD